ncbi:TonB-dependent receptor [Asticcacaulis machinosus]|uniref:TonB-dependent receptor n=1 Tax=Asticcacaulis machinosus TaxID=2984211 RepID=A0ABT5HKG4_9CAUL|nr:TonB-dependent receptor [Asticcacaulis machinosus]MDC7676708.1 TonB-dependent receptor [Asticcacaulis machinosus]
MTTQKRVTGKAGIHLALLATASVVALNIGAALPAMAQEEPATDVTEVIVTATRRATSVQKVPYNISVIGASDLSTKGITEIAELGRAMPGLSVRDVGSRDDASIILRGLSVDPLRASTLGDNGSVATYINDTPVTNQPKIFDIERVEVLRGPQGTLYGSGSLGGAIRYIVADPKMKYEASAGGKVYQINEADDVSYEVNGMINMPLVEDKLAVRVAAQYLDDSGFTDYPFVITGPKTDLDFEQRTTARASLLWTPTETFEATLSYYTDNSKSGGRTGGNPGFSLPPGASYPAFSYPANAGKVLGDYDIGLRFEEPYSMHYQLTALEMKYDLGFADLISSTSYTKKTGLGHRDQTDLLLGLGFGYENYPDFRAFTTEVDDFEAAVQELRLVSSDGGSFDYVAGLYYANEGTWGTSSEYTPGFTQFIGATRTDDLEYFAKSDVLYSEWAAFGELTWHINDQWQITGGARAFKLIEKSTECTALPLYEDPNSSVVNCPDSVGKTEVEDTIYKLNTSYQWTPDVMVYGTFSQGFRRGGVNLLPSGGQFVGIVESQRQYAPDTVDNYEVGVRSQWFDRKLTVNAALFNINWQDVQLSSLAPGNLPIIANAGEANSKGVELETLWKATDALTLSFGYAYTNAEISEDYVKADDNGTPADFTDDTVISDFRDGTSLPGTPEQQISLAADYTLPFTDYGLMTLHADYSYSSGITTSAEPYRCAVYQEPVQPCASANQNANLDYAELKGFSQTNLSFGWEPMDTVGVKLFVNNVFDEYAYVAQQGEATYGLQGKFFIPIRPRVIGVSINKKF